MTIIKVYDLGLGMIPDYDSEEKQWILMSYYGLIHSRKFFWS